MYCTVLLDAVLAQQPRFVNKDLALVRQPNLVEQESLVFALEHARLQLLYCLRLKRDHHRGRLAVEVLHKELKQAILVEELVRLELRCILHKELKQAILVEDLVRLELRCIYESWHLAELFTSLGRRRHHMDVRKLSSLRHCDVLEVLKHFSIIICCEES